MEYRDRNHSEDTKANAPSATPAGRNPTANFLRVMRCGFRVLESTKPFTH